VVPDHAPRRRGPGSIGFPFIGALAVTALSLLQGCAPLPILDGRVASVSIRDGADTRLGRAIMPLVQAHAGRSGVLPLLSARDSFAARVRLADAAQRSLDVQYYIWHKDLSGTLLLDALRGAADRGVRVRLLLAIGPGVDDVSSDFDRYWASGSSYPAKDVLAPVGTESVAALAAAATAVEQSVEAVQYMKAIADSPFVRSLLGQTLAFEWATVHMVSDDPAKGLGEVPDDDLLWARLKRVMKKPERELKLVSAYFVPGAEGVHFFTKMSAGGVKVQVLTNSLEATDVVAAHAGYARRRKALLEAGAILFELKRLSSEAVANERDAAWGVVGSSGSSLHAKTFAIDDSRIFVGSFNFDPRSARLNTEMGFVIDSPLLARSIADSFARNMPDHACEVRLARRCVSDKSRPC
jgi:phosphatidylserine/phosphatidylglycerophosphate/cardiolipin synthase-like enzyme